MGFFKTAESACLEIIVSDYSQTWISSLSLSCVISTCLLSVMYLHSILFLSVMLFPVTTRHLSLFWFSSFIYRGVLPLFYDPGPPTSKTAFLHHRTSPGNCADFLQQTALQVIDSCAVSCLMLTQTQTQWECLYLIQSSTICKLKKKDSFLIAAGIKGTFEGGGGTHRLVEITSYAQPIINTSRIGRTSLTC